MLCEPGWAPLGARTTTASNSAPAVAVLPIS